MIPSHIYLLVCTRATAKFDSEEASFANLLIFLERVESTLLDTKEQSLFLGGERERKRRERKRRDRGSEREERERFYWVLSAVDLCRHVMCLPFKKGPLGDCMIGLQERTCAPVASKEKKPKKKKGKKKRLSLLSS